MGFTLEEPVRVTPRLRLLGVAALAVVVVLGVVAWRASRPSLDPETAARTAAGVTVLVHTEDYEGPMTAMARSGRLTVLEGDCLGLDDGSLIVLPRGTRVGSRGGELTVRVDDDRTGRTLVLRPGDRIEFGGSVLTPTPVRDFGGDLAAQVPAACRDRSAVAADGGISRG